MASYPHNSASNKDKPWPAYFIVRTSGEVVPLIGVDELPIGVDLVGVPRALDLEDTIGMLNLGIQRNSETFYRIAQQEEEEEEEIANTQSIKTTKAAELTTTKLKASEAQQLSSTQSATRSTAISSNTTRTTHPRAPPETQTCRHWCTHGICKWGQRCRYRHIMPMTLPGLQGIGLNDWPAWYRALNPSYFASECTHLKPNFGRRGRREGKGCSGSECHEGLNLGPLGGVNARNERERQERVRERRKEELGELALASLRGLGKEKGKEGRSAEKEEEKVSGTVMLEKAAVKDAKNWEDEDSEVPAEESEEKVAEKGAKTSLLD